MFDTLVAIEPLNVTEDCRQRLSGCAKRIRFYEDRPGDDAEIIRRIGDADGVLVSYTTPVGAAVIAACPSLRYIGMCCSLYAPESANVDILAARARGVVVLGVRDYGDEGVVEYVVSELARLLHGFGPHRFRDAPMELTGVPVGILGLGATGGLVARGLRFFGAKVHYYSRTRKPGLERAEGYAYLPLNDLLGRVDILCACLNKNVVLLREREFSLFGNGKIFMNTSIAPAHEVPALAGWLQGPGNYALADTQNAIDPTGALLRLPNVLCPGQSAGLTTLAYQRLGEKVIRNIEEFFCGKGACHGT